MSHRGFIETTVTVPFVAGDASKTLVAAPGAGKFIMVTKVRVTITTSAAQSVDIESNAGAVELIKTPVSPAVGSQFSFESAHGIALPAATALVYQPSGAGNAGLVSVDYYIDGAF
jgi:hypothetical protein